MIKFSKNRLETFCDGVIAVIITIMVLNIPLPDTFSFSAIMDLLKAVLIFFVSFFIVGNHWITHHIRMERISDISNKLIWRTLLFLFFLALMPILTKWVILHSNEVVPVIGYDIVFLLVNISSSWIWRDVAHREGYLNIPGRGETVSGRSLWLRWAIGVGVVGAIIVLSLFYPSLSLIFFMGFPVVFSLFNLIFDRPERDLVRR
jgi:uncharacterized membrane protein